MMFGPVITEIVNEINYTLRQRDLTHADLAKRMKVSPGRVAQILSGGESFTNETLNAVATALDATWFVTLVPHGVLPEKVVPDADPGPA